MKKGTKRNQCRPSTQGKQGAQNQSTQDYVNLDGDENQDVPHDENVNENASVEDDDPGGQDDVQLKAKRQKKSTIWDEIVEVTLPCGTEKVKCIHCKKLLAVSSGKPTTTWKRHMEVCTKRQQFMRTQQLLNFQPVDIKELVLMC
ncbi:putative transcription factor/ chromatin remodeling BED-type(Zn) family [Helianthus debilis subsp. tardiflorus]